MRPRTSDAASNTRTRQLAPAAALAAQGRLRRCRRPSERSAFGDAQHCIVAGRAGLEHTTISPITHDLCHARHRAPAVPRGRPYRCMTTAVRGIVALHDGQHTIDHGQKDTRTDNRQITRSMHAVRGQHDPQVHNKRHLIAVSSDACSKTRPAALPSEHPG